MSTRLADLSVYEKKHNRPIERKQCFFHGSCDWLKQNICFFSLSFFLILLNKQMLELTLIVCIWLFSRSNAIHIHNLSNGMHACVTRIHQYGTRCKKKEDEMACVANRIRNGFWRRREKKNYRRACSGRATRRKAKRINKWLFDYWQRDTISSRCALQYKQTENRIEPNHIVAIKKTKRKKKQQQQRKKNI